MEALDDSRYQLRVERYDVAAVLLALTLAGLSPVSTMAILVLWTTGLSLVPALPYLSPGPGAVPADAGGLLAQRRRLWTAAGLLLVLLAGYMAESTYHHLLVLLGVAFLGGIAQQSRATSGRHDGSTEALPSRMR